jgi:poly(A) polymerase
LVETIANRLSTASPFALQLTEYLNVRIKGGHTRKQLIKLSALLHDVGKPSTRHQGDDGKLRFIGHEKKGVKIIRGIANRIKLSRDETHCITQQTMLHLRPGHLVSCMEVSTRAKFRFLRDANTEAVSIILLSLADKEATRGPLTTEEDIRRHQHVLTELLTDILVKKEPPPLPKLVNGDDLMRNFSLPPGKIIGKLLRFIEEAQVEGKVTTRQEALTLAADYLKTSANLNS